MPPVSGWLMLLMYDAPTPWAGGMENRNKKARIARATATCHERTEFRLFLILLIGPRKLQGMHEYQARSHRASEPKATRRQNYSTRRAGATNSRPRLRAGRISFRAPSTSDFVGTCSAAMTQASAELVLRCATCGHSPVSACHCCQWRCNDVSRVDSGRGQNRKLRPLSTFWSPVFAGEQDVCPPKG